MPNRACDYQSSPLHEVGLAVCFALRGTRIVGRRYESVSRDWGKQTPGATFSCRAFVGVLAPVAKAQRDMDFPSEFTGATGHITPERLLVGGSIRLQGGWTL
jgi:hypothetical protein